jgi:hypothetical protein
MAFCCGPTCRILRPLRPWREKRSKRVLLRSEALLLSWERGWGVGKKRRFTQKPSI